MKILGEKDTETLLNGLTREKILHHLQPHLLKSLNSLRTNGDIIPPRTVVTSNTPQSNATHLFMPCVGTEEVGLKVLTGGSSKGFKGCILVVDEFDGGLLGVLNAKVITAFRTALASTIPMVKVMETCDMTVLPQITVLGSGLQAFWHVKLALILFGDKFGSVSIVNRSIEGAEKLKKSLSHQFPDRKYNTFLYQDDDHQADIAASLTNSSLILGCLPTTEPIIKTLMLNGDKSVLKYINLIGSYKPHMLELEPEFINEQFGGTNIIVDSKDHVLHEAGELIQAGKTPPDLVEIAELMDPQVPDEHKHVVNKNGVVVLKLVGLSIMDISMAKYLLQTSGQLGTEVPDFDS